MCHSSSGRLKHRLCRGQRTLALFFLLHAFALGSHFDTSAPNQYQGQTVSCLDGEDCTVECDEQFGCAQSTIQCPTDTDVNEASCDVSCTAPSSCTEAHIACPPHDECDIHCGAGSASPSACQSATIDWPNVAGLGTLICDGPFACANTTFPEPDPNDALVIECDSTYQCANATIFCPTDAACNISCIGAGSCARMSLRCPEQHHCSVSCGSGEAVCANAVFDWSHTAGLGSLSCVDDGCNGANPPPSANAGDDDFDNDQWWVYALISILIGLVVFVLVYYFYSKGEARDPTVSLSLKPRIMTAHTSNIKQPDINVVSRSGNMSQPVSSMSPAPAISSISPAPVGDQEDLCEVEDTQEKSPVTLQDTVDTLDRCEEEETPIPTPSEGEPPTHVRNKSRGSTETAEEHFSTMGGVD